MTRASFLRLNQCDRPIEPGNFLGTEMRKRTPTTLKRQETVDMHLIGAIVLRNRLSFKCLKAGIEERGFIQQ
jgi:hypothetical protein